MYDNWPLTVEGYAEAKEYLISINEYDNFMNNRVSVDGYSLVAYANALYHKEQEDAIQHKRKKRL